MLIPEPPLPNRIYHDPALFAAEGPRIAETAWILLGPRAALAQHNDYIARRLFGVPVLVQNFQGNLRAFRNVCSHRSAPLRLEARGNAPITCPYHSWTYDSAGIPIGIPSQERLFGLAPAERAALALTRYSVALCGELVFVHLSETPPMSLADWLGPYFGTLARLSETCVQPLAQSATRFNANWKICVENSLDEYHIATVHPTSFGQNGLMKSDEFTYDYNGRHSAMRHHRQGRAYLGAEYLDGRLAVTPYRYDAYSIYFLFPNSVIIALLGTMMVAQSYEPLALDATSVEVAILTAEPAPRADIKQRKLDNAAAYIQGVFAEDRQICEAVGIGSQDAPRPGCFGAQEARIAHFQANYGQLMALNF